MANKNLSSLESHVETGLETRDARVQTQKKRRMQMELHVCNIRGPGFESRWLQNSWGHSSVVEREVSSILVVAKIRKP